MLANQIGPGPYFRFAFTTPLYWTPWLVIIHSSTRCFSMMSVGVQVNTKMFQRNQIQIGETVSELTFQDLVDFVDGNKGWVEPTDRIELLEGGDFLVKRSGAMSRIQNARIRSAGNINIQVG